MVTINICVGSACHLKGSHDIIKDLQKIIKDESLGEKVILKGAFCLGNCTNAVSITINDGKVQSISKGKVKEFFETHIRPALKE